MTDDGDSGESDRKAESTLDSVYAEVCWIFGYVFNAFSLWLARKIDLQTLLHALRNRPAAVAGRGGSYHIDPIDPNE